MKADQNLSDRFQLLQVGIDIRLNALFVYQMISDIAQVLKHQTHERTISITVKEAGSPNKLVVIANTVRQQFKHTPKISKRIAGITRVEGADVEYERAFEIEPVRDCAQTRENLGCTLLDLGPF